MGLDLKLLPFYSNRAGGMEFSHAVLTCGRDYDLFNAIQAIEKLRGRDVSPDFQSYVSRADDRDSHYGITIDTPYGEPLKWVQARYLAELTSDNPLNAPVLAYIKALPLDLPRHLFVPYFGTVSEAILMYMAAETMHSSHAGYVASWDITAAVPDTDGLDVIADSDVPGNKAMRRLKQLGLVEDVPALGCRYRLTALGCAMALALEKSRALRARAAQARGGEKSDV